MVTSTVCLISLFASSKYIFWSLIQLLQSAWEKNYVGTNLARLKYDLSQNNWLVFVVFFIYNFHLSFTALHYLSHAKKLSDFLFLNCTLDMSFRCYFPVFSQMLPAIVKESKFCGNPKT